MEQVLKLKQTTDEFCTILCIIPIEKLTGNKFPCICCLLLFVYFMRNHIYVGISEKYSELYKTCKDDNLLRSNKMLNTNHCRVTHENFLFWKIAFLFLDDFILSILLYKQLLHFPHIPYIPKSASYCLHI